MSYRLFDTFIADLKGIYYAFYWKMRRFTWNKKCQFPDVFEASVYRYPLTDQEKSSTITNYIVKCDAFLP